MALRVNTNSTTGAPTHQDEAATRESRRTIRRSKCFARTMYGALVFILLAAPTTEAATTEAPTTEGCSTVGNAGVGAGHPCTFPFGYKGVSYTTCTTAAHTTNWCYVQVDSAGNGIRGQWGDCGSSCEAFTCYLSELENWCSAEPAMVLVNRYVKGCLCANLLTGINS